MRINDLEFARKLAGSIDYSRQAAIKSATFYLDGYFPVRNTKRLFAVRYFGAEDPVARYVIVGEVEELSSFKGFLVSSPEQYEDTFFPYISMFGQDGRLGIHRIFQRPGTVPIVGAMRMGLMVVSQSYFPITPAVPTENQLKMCRVLRLYIHCDHCGPDGKKCPYSGTIAGGHYAPPATCPRCGHVEIEEIDGPICPTSPSPDACYAELRKEGVIWW